MQDLAIGHELTKSTQSYIPHPYLLEIAIQADVLQSSKKEVRKCMTAQQILVESVREKPSVKTRRKWDIMFGGGALLSPSFSKAWFKVESGHSGQALGGSGRWGVGGWAVGCC